MHERQSVLLVAAVRTANAAHSLTIIIRAKRRQPPLSSQLHIRILEIAAFVPVVDRELLGEDPELHVRLRVLQEHVALEPVAVAREAEHGAALAMKRHREQANEDTAVADAKAPRVSLPSDDSEKSSSGALVVELQSLTDAPLELVKQVRKLNLGVLPVQCPEFCYKRAVRDAKRLSWAATLLTTSTTAALEEEKRASNKSDAIVTVAGAIIAEYEALNHAVHVRTLAVEPRYRRLGIGHQLIDKVIAQALVLRQATEVDGEEAVRVESVRLHVHVGNADGLAFYMRAGFKEQARLENYYRHLEPRACLVLSYALPDEDSEKHASE